MKKLYTVTVEFEYAVLAEDEHEAKRSARDALRDVIIEDCAFAAETVYIPTHNVKAPQACHPDGWEGSALVYGADEDITLADAIEAEKQRLMGEQARAAIAKAKGETT